VCVVQMHPGKQAYLLLAAFVLAATDDDRVHTFLVGVPALSSFDEDSIMVVTVIIDFFQKYW